MPLPSLTPEVPQDLAGLSVAVGADTFKQAIAQSPPTTPPPVKGISLKDMPPVAAAGVRLAQFVLWIASGTIVAFIGYLFWIDFTVGADVLEEYRAVAYRDVPGIELWDSGALNDYLHELQLAKANPHFALDAIAAKQAEQLLKTLDQLAGVSPVQKSQIGSCNPLPTDTSREEKVSVCISRVAEIQAQIADLKAARSAKYANDALDRLASQRKSMHDFWLQAAQLVLLNLLLPLLTALFGYVFGTQSQHSTSETAT